MTPRPLVDCRRVPLKHAGITRTRRHSTIAAAAVVALVVSGLGVPAASAAGAAGQAAGVAAAKRSGKGTVGWDTYRRLDRLPELTTDVQTRQFSSFDRTGGNEDGFDGRYACLRQSDQGCVIAEASGAGEIGAIWFTRDEGNVTKTGKITIELDGKKVVDAPLQDLVDGKVGAPFVYPLVANADQTSGGVYIEVPMPYRQSMRVTTEKNPLFHHVSYRSFADAEGVKTFDPSDKAQDVVDKLKKSGTADPKPSLPGAKTTRTPLRVKPGASLKLASTNGNGLLSALRMTLPQAKYVEPKRVPDDGRAFGKDGSSEFTVKIDPANEGVKLTRRLDPMIGNQVAKILVDGKDAGQWGPSKHQGAGVWADETVTLPAELTKGKSKITVKNVFVSSDYDYNEFSYWAEVGSTRTDTVNIGNAEDEAAHGYTIKAQTWSGERRYVYPFTEAERTTVREARELLEKLRLRISFDGKQTVDSPLGEFYGTGHAMAPVRALMYGVDATKSDLKSWWPMPYTRSAKVELHNGSAKEITAGTAHVTSAKPTRPRSSASYFRTQSHIGATTPLKSWTLLKASGQGKFVGVSHTMRGRLDRNWLEGDERVYVDGSRSPQIHGTGTEDFYQSGWYFNRETYNAPFNGNPTHLTPPTGCADNQDCTGAYRLMISDAVPFGSSIDFNIEHGWVNDVDGEYSSTAYWYGQDAPAQRETDKLDVGDTKSESDHGYKGGGDLTTLESVFEGNKQDPLPAKETLRSTDQPVSFKLAIDPANKGVTIRRMSDQKTAGQRAAVSVDGTKLADWLQPLGNSDRRWLDDFYQLPASVTKGKTHITVTLTPNGQWSAAGYSALVTR